MKIRFSLSLLLFTVCILSNNLNAQRLNNKLDLFVGSTSGTFYGDEFLIQDGFEFPSVYSNLKNLQAISVQGLFRIHKNVSVGLILEDAEASNWSVNSHDAYNGAMVELFSLSQVIQIHNRFVDYGIWNKLKLSFGISSTMGTSSLSLETSLSDLQEEGVMILETDQTSESKFFGVKGILGIEFDLNQHIGIHTNFAVSKNWLESNLHLDKSFSSSQITVGFYKKFLRDKRYFY